LVAEEVEVVQQRNLVMKILKLAAEVEQKTLDLPEVVAAAVQKTLDLEEVQEYPFQLLLARQSVPFQVEDTMQHLEKLVLNP
jgi:hypothetical protein